MTEKKTQLIGLGVIIMVLFLGINITNKISNSEKHENCIKTFNGHIVKITRSTGFIRLVLDTGENILFGFELVGNGNNSDVFESTVHINDLFVKKSDTNIFATIDANGAKKEWVMFCRL